MSKYEPLWKSLRQNGAAKVCLTFAEIEEILGFPIDHSFLTYKKEAISFGYVVGKISLKTQAVQFEKQTLS